MKVTIAVVLVALACSVQGNVISSLFKSSASKEFDRDRTDEWVEKFYDQCGRTRNFNEGTEDDPLGNYKGLQVSKQCIGDRNRCIEERNCYFAVAIEEHFNFDKEYEDEPTTTTSEPDPTDSTAPASTTTPAPVFVKYIKSITKIDIKLLDTCHISPLPNVQTHTDKFVGLSFGTILENGKLSCDAESFQLNYDINNFRAFFFVNDFSQCDIKPDTPVHPYYRIGESFADADKITNHIEIVPETWNTMCNYIQETIPDHVTFTNISNADFMKYLTMTYYGTPGYATMSDNPNDSKFEYADDQTFVDNLGILRLGPKAEKRTVPSSSPVVNISIISILLVIVPIFKNFL